MLEGPWSPLGKWLIYAVSPKVVPAFSSSSSETWSWQLYSKAASWAKFPGPWHHFCTWALGLQGHFWGEEMSGHPLSLNMCLSCIFLISMHRVLESTSLFMNTRMPRCYAWLHCGIGIATLTPTPPSLCVYRCVCRELQHLAKRYSNTHRASHCNNFILIIIRLLWTLVIIAKGKL